MVFSKGNLTMLTDIMLRNIKPKDMLYKVNDRDDLYVAITPAGSISSRYNYAIHCRQETIKRRPLLNPSMLS